MNNQNYQRAMAATTVTAVFTIVLILAYLIAVPVGLYRLFLIPTHCPPIESEMQG